MSQRKAYRKRPEFYVTAVQLDLEELQLTHRKWGHTQSCKTGDWLVNNGGDVYTVDKSYFREHYQRISPGVYKKIAAVWAEVAEYDGELPTLEGTSAYRAGDYLVFDAEQGGHGYPVPRLRFERMYEELESNLHLSKSQQAYIDERIKPRMAAFKKKAQFNRRRYYLWQTTAIITAALVPVFTAFKEPGIQWIVAMLGASSAITAGVLGLFKHQENWMRYHRVYNELDSMLSRFELGLGEYSDREHAFELLAENCENILQMASGQSTQSHLHDKKEAASQSG